MSYVYPLDAWSDDGNWFNNSLGSPPEGAYRMLSKEPEEEFRIREAETDHERASSMSLMSEHEARGVHGSHSDVATQDWDRLHSSPDI